jgi:hypothetical protein
VRVGGEVLRQQGFRLNRDFELEPEQTEHVSNDWPGEVCPQLPEVPAEPRRLEFGRAHELLDIEIDPGSARLANVKSQHDRRNNEAEEEGSFRSGSKWKTKRLSQCQGRGRRSRCDHRAQR